MGAGDDFRVLCVAWMLRKLDPAEELVAMKVDGPPDELVHQQIGQLDQAADVTLVRQTAD